MTDYAGAIWYPNNNYFPDTGPKKFLILHGTAGGSSAQGIASYFRSTENTENPVSSNYVVDQAGIVVQCVAEKDGAYAQGVVNNPNWLGNPNLYCLSIEHVKSSTDNSDTLTAAQQAASFKLIKDICQRNGIGMHDADDTTGVTGHFAIDPVNRARCPGTYPWDALWAYLKGGQPMPQQPTSQQTKEAEDCWESFFRRTLGQTPPPKGTGIYKAWLNDWVNWNKQYGPPLTYEYVSSNWGGQNITVQEFAHARCEWRDGAANWYAPSGKI